MGIFVPSEECVSAFKNSVTVSEPLVRLILKQDSVFDPSEIAEEVKTLRAKLDCDADEQHKEKFNRLNDHGSVDAKRTLKLGREKGASSWVTAAPSYDHGTILNKGEFVDSVCMRYGWDLPDLPITCACGAGFSVQHALDCMIGGYRTIQHNEVRDLLPRS